MLTIDEMKKMDLGAINRKVAELRVDIFKMKMQKITSGIEKPHLIKETKKNIARLLTIKNFKAQGK